jgi:hypothetical protein
LGGPGSWAASESWLFSLDAYYPVLYLRFLPATSFTWRFDSPLSWPKVLLSNTQISDPVVTLHCNVADQSHLPRHSRQASSVLRGLRGTGFLKCLSHEASSASSAPGHVCLQAIASVQAVNILRIAAPQPSIVSECSDKSVTPARIDRFFFDLLAQRGNELVEHGSCRGVLPNTCVKQVLVSQS